jgi:hypothetical protein
VPDHVGLIDPEVLQQCTGVVDVAPDADLVLEPITAGVAAAVVADELVPFGQGSALIRGRYAVAVPACMKSTASPSSLPATSYSSPTAFRIRTTAGSSIPSRRWSLDRRSVTSAARHDRHHWQTKLVEAVGRQIGHRESP